MHYKRLRRWGDPNIRRPKTPADERFWAKVDKDGPSPAVFRHRGPCWVWTGGKISTGYGFFHPTKQTHVLAHRYAYELLRGPIPDGLCIDHLCRNRVCVNPAHLEPVTLGENTRRGLSISTFNALKTHCPAGHAYTPENTYVQPTRPNTRRCRECSASATGSRTATAAFGGQRPASRGRQPDGSRRYPDNHCRQFGC